MSHVLLRVAHKTSEQVGGDSEKVHRRLRPTPPLPPYVVTLCRRLSFPAWHWLARLVHNKLSHQLIMQNNMVSFVIFGPICHRAVCTRSAMSRTRGSHACSQCCQNNERTASRVPFIPSLAWKRETLCFAFLKRAKTATSFQSVFS